MTTTPLVVAGSIAQRPANGGHAWAFLNYLSGIRKLGFEPVFMDRLEPEMVGSSERRFRACVEWLREVMAFAGMDGSWAILRDGDTSTIGLARDELLGRIAAAPALLNVMGFVTDEDVLATARRRVFVDIDPGFGQMWRELGLADVFAGHDAYVTVGTRLGKPGCRVPTCGIDWVHTLPPVDLDSWPEAPGGSGWTSVGSWRGPFEPVSYAGERFGLRVHAFRPLAELPRLAGGEFEVALEIDDADAADHDVLERNGWVVRDAAAVAATPAEYRAYIQGSFGEVLVAKEMYVKARSGWFSDRSACYLASGKPVIALDTGFSEAIPMGEGLLAFDTVEEAAAAHEAVLADPPRHRAAARRIAEDLLDSRLVLAHLLERVGA